MTAAGPSQLWPSNGTGCHAVGRLLLYLVQPGCRTERTAPHSNLNCCRLNEMNNRHTSATLSLTSAAPAALKRTTPPPPPQPFATHLSSKVKVLVSCVILHGEGVVVVIILVLCVQRLVRRWALRARLLGARLTLGLCDKRERRGSRHMNGRQHAQTHAVMLQSKQECRSYQECCTGSMRSCTALVGGWPAARLGVGLAQRAAAAAAQCMCHCSPSQA